MTESDDGNAINEECPFCDTEKIPTRIGHHLYEEHWKEIGALASEKTPNDSEAAEPLHTQPVKRDYPEQEKEQVELALKRASGSGEAPLRAPVASPVCSATATGSGEKPRYRPGYQPVQTSSATASPCSVRP